jgi:hypothetical protein
MYLIFSGEGSTDMGNEEYPGPMLHFIDRIASKKLSFSLLKEKCYEFISRSQLSERAKQLSILPKAATLPGRKRNRETAEFYKNARALAVFAKEREEEKDGVLAVLFRDSDTVEQDVWQTKWDSVCNGFDAADFTRGVPMIPKPVSEAWILCAIYRKENIKHDSSKLENTKHGSDDKHSLKIELEKKLGERPTRELLNDKIQSGKIDEGYINLASFKIFKSRLTELLGCE